MLKSKYQRRRDQRSDWFSTKVYLHFDAPMKRRSAELLVTDTARILRHSFLPMMAFEKIERRYRRSGKKGLPIVKFKSRKLAYCSNRDAYIFSYYAQILNQKYEKMIENYSLDQSVIGYRRLGSNIDLARRVFNEIDNRKDCVAFAFDISGFFDNIDHSILKRAWCRILGVDRLPDDHFVVFSRLTKFSTVDRRACLRRLGLKPSARDRELPRTPLCSIVEFRNKIAGGDGISTNLISEWKRDYRIPQGTPLSALAANISMLNFDISISSMAAQIGGSYRRYSDDILIIVPTSERCGIPALVVSELKKHTRRLVLNDEKTEEIEFALGLLASGKGSRPLQYLGFTYDGEKILLRSKTLAKYWRRVHQKIFLAKIYHKRALRKLNAGAGGMVGRPHLHKRAIYSAISHLGIKNFITGYAADSRAKMGGSGIKSQLSRHPKKIKELISRKL